MNWQEIDALLNDSIHPEIRATFHEIGQEMHDLDLRIKQIEKALGALKPAIDSLGTNVASVIDWIDRQPDIENREIN